jgi:cytochrome bd-type quinol oxidase subunit 2
VKIAQITNPALDTTSTNGVSFVGSLLQALINLGLLVGAVVFMFMLLIGGIRWISSGSDKAAYERARTTLVNALIGLTIVLGLYGIISIVEHFFGIKLTVINIDLFKIDL